MYILLLLLLTLLIFKTLFNSFGVTTTDDRDRAIKDFVRKISPTKENTINGEVVNNKKEKNKLPDDIKNNLSNIYKNYINKKNNNSTEDIIENAQESFNRELFLKSSEKAVVSILNYFSEENLNYLKMLLTENMYEIFEKQILQNREKEIKYKTIIISIKNKEILDVSNCDTKVVLKLEMEQMNYVEDKDGNVINGSREKVDNIEEIWTFVKKDQMWLLDSIK